MLPRIPNGTLRAALAAAFFLFAANVNAAPSAPALSASAIRSQIKNPALGDACISSPDGDLTVVTSAYLAGAVSAVVWNGIGFIDDMGHGGSMQYVVSVDGLGNFYTGSENGARDDDYHFRRLGDDRLANIALQTDDMTGPPWATTPRSAVTSSLLKKFTSAASTIRSESQPAFLLSPGASPDTWTDAQGVKHPGPPVANTSTVSGYLLKKTITIAPVDLHGTASNGLAHVIKLEAVVTVPPLDDVVRKALSNPSYGVVGTRTQASPSVTIQAPAANLYKDFSKYYELSVPAPGAAARLIDISKSHGTASGNEPYDTANPVIFSTPDDQRAMGVYSFPGQTGAPPALYRTYAAGSAYSPDNAKWNVLYHAPVGDKTATYSYTTFLVMGTVAQVRTGMLALIAKYPQGKPLSARPPVALVDTIRSQVKNPAMGDACISSPDGNLIVVTSGYLAGAISGIFWKGKQFIDDEGHGGSLQYALVVDGIGSSYNPTEAGGKSDDYHFRRVGDDHIANITLETDDILGPVWATVPQTALTNSLLQKFSVTRNSIHSEVRPAFWLNSKNSSPDMWTDDNDVQHPAAPMATASLTSNYVFKKTVTLAPGGLANVIRLDGTIIVPPIDDEIKKALANPATGVVGTKTQTSPSLTIDAPVGYPFKEFSKTYELIPDSNSATATLADISKTHGAPSKNDPYETHHPFIYATTDDQYAMGVYSFPGKAGAPPVTYRTYVLGSAYSQTIGEWEAAYHVPLGGKSVTLSYTTYLVLGTVPEVKTGLLALMRGKGAGP